MWAQPLRILITPSDSAEVNMGISTVDVSGIALVAIQALHEDVTERDRRIADLEQQIADLRVLVRGLVQTD